MNGKCLASDCDQTNKDLVNPFVHHLELTTTYEKIKAGILTVVVLPVRLLVIFLLLAAAWLLACIGLYGLSEKDLQAKPLSRWRRYVRSITKFLFRCMMFAWGFHWVRVRGQPASRRRAPLIAAAPHSSFFDALPAVMMDDISVITTQENLDNLVLGKLINFTQPVYVRRDDPDSRHNTIQQIIKRAKSPLDWSQMLIFPEGTCTNRSCLITFKPGAFYPGVPVQPVILRYPNKLDTVTWTWQGPGALKLMWLTLVQTHSNCEIEFLPVYKPSKAERRDPKLYAENVRKLMAQALGVPMRDYTYDDCKLVAKSNLLGVPQSCRILQIHKLRIRLGLTRNNREESLLAEQPDILLSPQTVDFDEFTERLSIPKEDPTVSDLYNLLELDTSGKTDFSEYLLSVLMVDRSTCRRDMLERAFTLSSATGRLTPRQVAGVLRLSCQLSVEQAQALSENITTDDDGLVSFHQFESFMKKRPDLEIGDNNNGAHHKAD